MISGKLNCFAKASSVGSQRDFISVPFTTESQRDCYNSSLKSLAAPKTCADYDNMQRGSNSSSTHVINTKLKELFQVDDVDISAMMFF